MEVLALGVIALILSFIWYGSGKIYQEHLRHNQELERIGKEQSELLRQIEYKNRVR